jgi:hypothetical protein
VRGRADVSGPFPVLPTGKLAVGPAQRAAIAAPELKVLADVTADGQRRLRLRLEPRRPVRLLGVYGDVGNRRVVRAAIDGREVAPFLTDRDRFGLQFHAVADDGFDLDLTISGAEPLRLRLIDGSDGLDGLPGFRQRPSNVGVAGTYSSDLVAGALTVTI